MAHEEWDQAVGKSRGRKRRGEQAGLGSRGWWGASERRGLTTLEEEKRFARRPLGQEPARCEDHLGKGPKVAASPGGPRDSKEASVCGEGARRGAPGGGGGQ